MLPQLTAIQPGPAPPALESLEAGSVSVWYDPTGAVCAYGYARAGQYHIHVPEVASFQFSHRAAGVTATTRPRVAPALIQDVYRRLALPLILQALGTEVLHASAVLTREGVLAFCAVSGTGKSTLAYALSRQGHRLWADDAVPWELTGPGVQALPLPFALRLRPATAAFFPPAPDGPPGETGSSSAGPPARLAGLCVLRRVPGAETTVQLTRLTPAAAFPLVLAHAECFTLHDLARKRQMLANYLALTTRVPVWEVAFVPGFDRLAQVVAAVGQAIDTLCGADG
ncbi:MAG TPA: hypothetical protein VKY74_03745 [Chloroflexia bacterium]|nr:hypothetical protein [Chloroflexia bacterium]